MATFMVLLADQSVAMSASVPVDRFRAYTGERTIETLTELFTQPTDANIRQLPEIAISDGKTAVLVALKLPLKGNVEPFISFQGAKILSKERKKQDEWLFKVLPDTNSLNVSLVAVSGIGKQIFPLIVAPPILTKIDTSEQGFIEFLRGDDAGKPLLDLNNDGLRNYLDEYIYTANFLASKSVKGRDLKARQQRALQRTLTQSPLPTKTEFDPDMFD